jgi:glycosyltransferase involved in cell wall biosynthesis
MNHSAVGVVIIGRNEGARLLACIDSLSACMPQVVYVDSASTDHSVQDAKNLGAHVVSLDMTQAFTAARARNTGFDTIISLFPHIKFVQFVDGDCIVDPKWISTGFDFLINNAKTAVVCGRRRELYPYQSVYNNLCDLEWNTSVGEAKACGGDALMRVEVLKQVGGYRNSLIAGEEPELCIRIRQAGYVIWRLDAEMTLHDAAITKFSQWWKRTTRAGYAYAEGAYLHGAAPEYHWVTESKRAWVWGALIPIAILLAMLVNPVAGLIILLIYPLQILRITLKSQHEFKDALTQAFFLTIGKFAEATGQIKFWLGRYSKQQTKIIEYK